MVNNFNGTHAAPRRKAGWLLALGWIFGLVSVFIYPFVFGLLGVVMGILSTKSGSRAGLVLIVGSIVLMGIGLIFSGVILNNTRHLLGI
ncbi:MAG: hypothetical protein Q8920_05585 [Bacillota bacterium]|nr:hypothetical protein [Bacillota bacterium]